MNGTQNKKCLDQCLALAWLMLAGVATASAQDPLQSADYLKMKSVGDVEFSPDRSRIAYSVSNNDGGGRPYSQLWIMDTAGGKTVRVGEDAGRGNDPVWSRDGTQIAFSGKLNDQSGILLCRADGSSLQFLTATQGSNSSALAGLGNQIAWSPDGKRIAFVSATPGPETGIADGDPMVITRYLYKPTLTEGNTRFNDNKRLHIFVLDLATKQVKQLTDGVYDEHSIDWSPDGTELVFVSNRDSNAEQFFNHDLFALKVSDGSIRRITATESAEYRPRWSPDGKTIAYQATRRGITDLETQMEDTHVWTVKADGTDPRELGRSVDNRQGAPEWSADGSSIYATVQERGNVRLYRWPVNGGKPEVVVDDAGSVTSFSVGKGSQVAYAFNGTQDLAQLYVKSGSSKKALTALNADLLRGKSIATTEAFTFVSNDNKYQVEAWLTRPIGVTATSKHPLIANIHGGPHGQQGPAFNFANQAYAAKGYAVVMVNYRGSTGYGQAWSDAVFRDQNGDEAQDVIYGVRAAIRRNPWIDPERLGVEGGSYGGQLSAWIVTATPMFKAAIPRWPIINLVSYNYMTYYNMYEDMEFGVRPHVADWMDELWRRSSLRYVGNVKTPVMLMHGENDNDVPIAESEQFYIGLKDAGVEAVMVRYPREGHGLREPKHTVDMIDRSLAWYEKHFAVGK
jgi:dipeptidyl aminopeptidase/acylaminoacyl peptidase